MSLAEKTYKFIAGLNNIEVKTDELNNSLCNRHLHSFIVPGESLMLSVKKDQVSDVIILFRDGTAIAGQADNWSLLCNSSSLNKIQNIVAAHSVDNKRWDSGVDARLCLRDTTKPLNPCDLIDIYGNHVTATCNEPSRMY